MGSSEERLEHPWTPARLIPVAGIKGQDEQERRATSSLLSVMYAVPEFGRILTSELKAPKGRMRTYTEIRLKDADGNVHIPDGAIVVERGKTRWVCLVEVKTGTGALTDDQVSRYMEMAKQHGYDAVLTISNEITQSTVDSPVVVPKRLTNKIPLYHFSWWKIITEAIVQSRHRKVFDPDQAWILEELIAYLLHGNSGASGFTGMGENWVKVRTAAHDGTLRSNDPEVHDVVGRWGQFVQYLCLDLSQQLGQEVVPWKQRNRTSQEHFNDLMGSVAETGSLNALLKVPNAIAPLSVDANLKTKRLETSAVFNAPQEGRPLTRIKWLIRQLKQAPDNLRIDVSFTNSKETTSALLKDVRDNPDKLLSPTDVKRCPKTFRIVWSQPLGVKKGNTQGSFVNDTKAQVGVFYGEVLQDLQPWRATAPRLPEEKPVPNEPDPVTESGEARTSLSSAEVNSIRLRNLL